MQKGKKELFIDLVQYFAEEGGWKGRVLPRNKQIWTQYEERAGTQERRNTDRSCMRIQK